MTTITTTAPGGIMGAAAAPETITTPSIGTPQPPSGPEPVTKFGSTTPLTDAAGNTWSITLSGQVAVNGVIDPTTANVAQLADVNGTIWQENTSDLWWGKTDPTAPWAPGSGTATVPLPLVPLPAPLTSPGATEPTTTVTQSAVSVQSTSGDHMVFISGSDDTVSASGGVNTITDTGKFNTYVLPVAGNGTDIFTGDIFASGAILDLHAAFAAAMLHPSTYGTLSVTQQGQNSEITMGQSAIATLQNTPGLTLGDVIAHSSF